MCTTFPTLCQESWWGNAVLPSGVAQSSLSTEFDLTLNRPGSPEIFGLCLPELGKQLELPWPPISGHWLTAFSIRWLHLQNAMGPG